MKLDPACADGSRCAFTSCSRSVRALPAVYALSLTAEVDCIDNCECEPSSAGWCAIQGDSITYLSNEIEALAVIDYPTDTAVELVFN